MFIMNEYENEIINVESVERFCMTKKTDAVLIVASYCDTRPPVTVARYKDVKEAKAALRDLFGAIEGGQACFAMPPSLLYAEEPWKRDARTKRKGGS